MRIFFLSLTSFVILSHSALAQTVDQVCSLRILKGKTSFTFTGTIIQPGNYILTVAHPFLTSFDKLVINCSGVKRGLTRNQIINHPNATATSPNGSILERKILLGLNNDKVIESQIGDIAKINLSEVAPIPPGKNSVRLGATESEILNLIQNTQCFGYGYGTSVQRQIGLPLGNRMSIDGGNNYLSDPNHFFIYPSDDIKEADAGGPILCSSATGELVLVGIIRGTSTLNVPPVGSEPVKYGSAENINATLDWIKQSNIEHASKN